MAKSFFERLAGGIRINEEPEERASEHRAPPPPPPAPARGRRRPEAEPPASRVLHPVATEEVGRAQPAEAEREEDEGQLTVDIYDDGAAIVIQSTVAGVKPEDIDISLQDNTLTIRGARSRHREVDEANFYYRELYWGAFSRAIILPEEVDFQKADAAIKNGLLTIRLPKKDRGEKKIRVKAGD